MSTIPHANHFPLFKCQNAAGVEVDLKGPQPFPREIEDYVLDSSKWPARFNTVNKILRANARTCRLACEACDERVRRCAGQACIVGPIPSSCCGQIVTEVYIILISDVSGPLSSGYSPRGQANSGDSISRWSWLGKSKSCLHLRSRFESTSSLLIRHRKTHMKNNLICAAL